MSRPPPKEDAEYIARYRANQTVAHAIKTKLGAFKPDCIRNISNWSGLIDRANAINLIEPGDDLMSPEDMDPERRNMLDDLITIASPKARELIETIDRLDAEDMREHGKHFKHFIFTDLKSRKYGINILASALILNGWSLGYTSEFYIYKAKYKSPQVKEYSPIHIKSVKELEENAGRNFFILTSRTIFKQPIKIPLRREILATFNARPENVYGERARIIIMDSGFKEGIDLFDIKYVHVFEPQQTFADLKQVVGRGTRTCGQKGLPFDPKHGWPLHVYLYDLTIDTDLSPLLLGARTAFELYQRAKGVDVRMFNFIGQIEDVLSENAVDAVLTEPVHGDKVKYHRAPRTATEAAAAAMKIYVPPETPPKTAAALRDYIKTEYGDEFTWETPKVENGCIDVPNVVVSSSSSSSSSSKTSAESKKGGATAAVQLLNFTMSQGFIANYFTPANFAKGMLLWHSVGTGKTCTAIATASKSFEQAGYTILWVTRTTLRADVWKNVFGTSCHMGVRAHLAANGILPEKFNDQRRLLSKAWKIQPISYKQFTNLIERKNDIYKKLAAINGEEDPLRKTLLIIDEAHKLYGVSDLTAIERPNMEKLHSALMTSYIVSGEDSCRLLAMTATPITYNPMEIVQLLNLMRPIDDQLPAFFANFSAEYLNSDGEFTKSGYTAFCNATAGYVSYLNLERDMRKFAQPIIHRVDVPMVSLRDVLDFDKRRTSEYYRARLDKVDQRMAELNMYKRIHPKAPPRPVIAAIKDHVACDAARGEMKKGCQEILKTNLAAFKADFRMEYDRIVEELRPLREKKRAIMEDKQAAAAKFKKLEIEAPRGYLLGPFNQIKRKCRLPAKNARVLEDIVNADEEVAGLNADLAGLAANEVQTLEELRIIKSGIIKLRRLIKAYRFNAIMLVQPMIQLQGELRAVTAKKQQLRDIRKNIRHTRSLRRLAAKDVERVVKKHLTAEMKIIKQYQIFTNNLEERMHRLGSVKPESDANFPLMIKTGDDIAAVADAADVPKSAVIDVLEGLPMHSDAELKRLDDEVRTLGMTADQLLDHYMKKTKAEIASFRRHFRCPDGKRLDSETGRCVKEKTAKVAKTVKTRRKKSAAAAAAPSQ